MSFRKLRSSRWRAGRRSASSRAILGVFVLEVPVEGLDHLGAIDQAGRGGVRSEVLCMIHVEEVAPVWALRQRSHLGARHFVDVVGTCRAVRKFAVFIEKRDLSLGEGEQ